MKRITMLALVVGLLTASPGLAQDPGLAQEGAVSEDLTHWKAFVPLSLPEPGKLAGAILTPAVFGAAKPDLGDLRLVDQGGRTIPYALRTLAERIVRQKVAVKPFDRLTLPDSSQRLSLDLGPSPPEHNELDLDVTAASYGRPLVLESSDNGKDWGTILDKVEVVKLDIRGQSINVTRFSYPSSRQRYLRVTLRPDRVSKENDVLRGASVFFSLTRPGKWAGGAAQIEYRDPVRAHDDAASAWVLDLGEPNVPVSQLTLHIDQERFSRPFYLEAYEPGRRGEQLVSGTLSRQGGHEPIVLVFPETRTRRLKLTVIDSRNPPLTLQKAEYAAPARLLVFQVPAGSESLRLYIDNPEARAPNYDFADTLPRDLGEIASASFGSREANPAYVPPPPETLPFTERYPYLLDVVLIVSLAVLAGLLFLLARTAIRRHDTAAEVA